MDRQRRGSTLASWNRSGWTIPQLARNRELPRNLRARFSAVASRTRIQSRLGWTLTLLCVMACASSPPPPTLVLSVSNQLGRTIAELWMKNCDDAESELVEIEDSKLRFGETRGFVLPPTCVDLVAFDERGRLVGQQRELHMLPGARWVLQR